jgi:predicted acyltransferase
MTTAPVSAIPVPAASTSLRSGRLPSVDVLRGLMVIGMVLVTNAGDWSHVYWPLKHADWNGSTPTDMIFPSFLFLAGLSMTYSFAARMRRGVTRPQLAKHVVVRSVLLVVLGLVLNGFPLFDLANLRIPGVLQRIGLCFLFTGLVYLTVSGPSPEGEAPEPSAAALIGVIAALMVSYWALMRFVPVPGYGTGRLDMVGNLGAYIDRSLMTTKHLWFWGGQMWDPEGLLSTMTATANMLLGVIAGLWMRTQQRDGSKTVGLLAVGIALMLAGLLLNPVIPINKKIWTDAFVLFSGGFSMAALALLHWLLDGVRGERWRGVCTPALVYGSNAVLGFALANMLNPLIGFVKLRDAAGQPTTINAAFVASLDPLIGPWNASLAYAILFTLVVMAMLWPLYRRRIFLRL